MADNENHPPEQGKPDKKLKLDLSEAMPHGFDEDDDDIIELNDEVTPPAQDKLVELEQETELDMEEDALLDDDDAASELPAVENIIDLDALEEDDDDEPENVIRLSDDLTFEEEGEMVDLPPIDKESVLKADDHDDVVEITEFDDILSENTDEMVTFADISEELDIEEEKEEADDDDEFLELIDVEDDDVGADIEEMEEDLIQFDEPDSEVEDAELKDLINESLDDDIQVDNDFEDDLASTLGVDAGEEINLAVSASAEEEFDFSMDSSEISKKIDQLDTIFFDDTEAEAEFEDEDEEFDEDIFKPPHPEPSDDLAEMVPEDIEFESDEIETEDIETEDIEADIEEDEAENTGVSGGESIDVPLAVGGIAGFNADTDQIEKAIEQVIDQKFSNKIETLITQIIEKAVSKEIKRLKKILLEDDGDENL